MLYSEYYLASGQPQISKVVWNVESKLEETKDKINGDKNLQNGDAVTLWLI